MYKLYQEVSQTLQEAPGIMQTNSVGPLVLE